MPLTADQAKVKANTLYQRLTPRAEEARELRGFYKGNQPLVFASDQWKQHHKDRYKNFSDNWCGVVANSPAERLGVIGFTIDGASKRNQTALWDEWLRNEQDSISSQGFLEAIVARRGFAHVWGDSQGNPIITWRSAEQGYVEYDAETGRTRVASLNIWDDVDAGFEYLTLATADEVWRFRRSAFFKGAGGLELPPNVSRGVGGWDLVPDNPYGVNHLGMVPMVELQNRPMLGEQPLSDISGTIAMQNAINLLWAYLFNAADFASMPARVVMGQEPPKIPILDQNGQKIGEKAITEKQLTEGRMLWLTGQNTTIGQWDAAKLDVFTGVIEQAVGHIAAQTRTPPHYLVANKGLSNLSGDALTAAEAGLVQKVRQARGYFEPRIKDIFQLIALQLGMDKLAAGARLGRVAWKNAEQRSDAQVSDAIIKDRQAGYPFEYLLEKYGESPSNITRIMQLRQQEQNDLLGLGVQSAVNDAVNAG